MMLGTYPPPLDGLFPFPVLKEHIGARRHQRCCATHPLALPFRSLV